MSSTTSPQVTRKRSRMEQELGASKKIKVDNSRVELIRQVQAILPTRSRASIESILLANNDDIELTINYFLSTLPGDEQSSNIRELEDKVAELERRCHKYEGRINVLTGGYGWTTYKKLQSSQGPPSRDTCDICYESFGEEKERYRLSCGCDAICSLCYDECVYQKRREVCPFCTREIKLVAS